MDCISYSIRPIYRCPMQNKPNSAQLVAVVCLWTVLAIA